MRQAGCKPSRYMAVAHNVSARLPTKVRGGVRSSSLPLVRDVVNFNTHRR